MQVTYKPEDFPDRTQVWNFDPNRIRQSRGEMIEKRYGARFADWVKEVQAGEFRARRVLLWHLMNLDHVQVKLEDVPDFMMAELEVDYGTEDLQKLRTQVVESSMDDATKETTLERLDLEIATRLGKTLDEVTPEDLGKGSRSVNAESSS